jgi:hypothetical protein
MVYEAYVIRNWSICGSKRFEEILYPLLDELYREVIGKPDRP